MNYPIQWKQIQSGLLNNRVNQSMLFVGPLHCALAQFSSQVMQLFLCKETINAPCSQCNDCKMVERMEHPDIEWVKPEKIGGSIKIDQIRELQNSAYLTPQRAKYRLIAIEAADRMNTASANALLKILEEPAKHTIFILIAQQLSTILPTILSRCYIIPFSSAEDSYSKNLLMLGELYPHDSERAMIVKQAETILDGLIALLEQKEHPCILTAQLTQYELGTMLWFLYLVYSQLQYMHISKSLAIGPASQQLNKLVTLIKPMMIFIQIDKINTLLKKISHNINVNHTLILEDLFFILGTAND